MQNDSILDILKINTFSLFSQISKDNSIFKKKWRKPQQNKQTKKPNPNFFSSLNPYRWAE